MTFNRLKGSANLSLGSSLLCADVPAACRNNVTWQGCALHRVLSNYGMLIINNNKQICIAPLGRNFRGAGARQRVSE